MSRKRRVHVPDGIYLVLQRVEPGHSICADEGDYQHLLNLIGRSVQLCRAHLLAFFVGEEEMRLVIEVTDVPLGRCLQRITRMQSRYMHEKVGEVGRMFSDRYRAALLPSKRLLPALVRCVHRSPIELRLSSGLAAYRWSSHRAYLGEQRVRGLRTASVLRALVGKGEGRVEAYRRFMKGNDTATHAWGAPAPDDRATAEQWLAWCADQQRRRERFTADRVIDGVVQLLDVDRAVLLSRARSEHLTFARALIAHFATKSDVASWADVQRVLGRSRSTLHVAIERYQSLWPQAFGPKMFALVEKACANIGRSSGRPARGRLTRSKGGDVPFATARQGVALVERRRGGAVERVRAGAVVIRAAVPRSRRE